MILGVVEPLDDFLVFDVVGYFVEEGLEDGLCLLKNKLLSFGANALRNKFFQEFEDLRDWVPMLIL